MCGNLYDDKFLKKDKLRGGADPGVGINSSFDNR